MVPAVVSRSSDEWIVPQAKGAYREIPVGIGANGEPRPGDLFRPVDDMLAVNSEPTIGSSSKALKKDQFDW